MATTTRQDNEFAAAVIPGSLLELAIDWIQRNLSPEDVFPDKALVNRAEENGYSEATE
jgi:hypothetical protein